MCINKMTQILRAYLRNSRLLFIYQKTFSQEQFINILTMRALMIEVGLHELKNFIKFFLRPLNKETLFFL